MRFIRVLPLFAVMLVAYHLVVFIEPTALTRQVFALGLASGATWSISGGDLMLAAGLLLLYIELIKATGTGTRAVINHSLSMLVFVVFAIDFVTVSAASTSTFFLLALMALVDAVTGFTIGMLSARRDLSLTDPRAD